MIIDGCGEFSNVPLLGINGGINYNPALARRQFGYPMTDKPGNIFLEGIFYLDKEGDSGMKDRIIQAWRSIHVKGKDQLGQKLGIASETYLDWVRARALELKIPYPRQKPLPVLIEEPTPYYMTDVEELQVALTKARQERDVWKSKCQVINFENSELRREAKDRDDLLHFQEDWLAEKDKEIHR